MSAFKSKKFSWRKGYSYSVSAETVGNVLASIEQKEGQITSQSFLDYSRNEEAETHSMFEWNDSIAAEKFRLSQATRIINQLEVELVAEDPATKEEHVEIVPAYVNTVPKITPLASGRFLNVVTAMGDDESRRNVLFNALRDLTAFRRKYTNIAEFSKLFALIDNLVEELKAEVV